MEPEKEFLLIKDFAEIRQIEKGPQDNMIRLYLNQCPDNFTLQIRTYKPIVRTGVAREMIATVPITLAELEKMLKYAKKQLKKYKR